LATRRERKTLAKLCEWAFAFGCGSMTTMT
jgi:hypothetical protein